MSAITNAVPEVRRGEPTGRPLRVCLLVGQLGLGGVEKQVVLLARGLRERGVDATVLAMFGDGDRDAELRAADVPVAYLGFWTREAGWRRWPANLVAFFRLVRCLRRVKPDVLHAFLLYSYVLAAPAARLARVPALVAGRRSLGDFKENHPLWRAVERLANRATDLLIANADAVAEDTRRREGVPPGKIAVVYNGLPDSAFAPVPPASLDAPSPVVLCVANFWHYKGHRFLIEAAAKLRDQGNPCTLVLVGQQPPSDPLERVALGDLVERLGVDARFLGPRTDVERLLARADVFVLPSLTEGMSNSVMEAMAAGLPVVATDVGGTRELLDSRGVLVPPADSDALMAGLARVLTDAEFAAGLGREARAWSRSHLHVDTMVDRHIRIYRDLLRPTRKASANG